VKDIIIIGGGLAGLVSAIQMQLRGYDVMLIEKKTYPFHRVCGEYISNEVVPYLKSMDCFPEELAPSSITKFKLTSSSGKIAAMPLDLGGFGISRFAFDHWLAGKAKRSGVELKQGTTADRVQFENDQFLVLGSSLNERTKVVIGAFGKRSTLDSSLVRPSFKNHSAYVGVKYHCTIERESDVISLHNFKGGYCGVCSVENGTVNVCYLIERELVRKYGDIKSVEEDVLFQNPYLEDLFKNAKFHWDNPLTINEISFAAKEPVFDHILMTGDAAGMITPLAGNGMSLAIHASKILCEEITSYLSGETGRIQLEKNYAKRWNANFQQRLWYGRKIQTLFGNTTLSNFAVNLVKNSAPISRFLMKQTHGDPF